MFGVPITANVTYDIEPSPFLDEYIIVTYSFKGIVPTIQTRNVAIRYPDEYRFSSLPINTFPPFLITRIDNNNFKVGDRIPGNVPRPTIKIKPDPEPVYGPEITFILTSDIQTPFTNQIKYILKLPPVPDIILTGTATPYRNA